MKKYKKKSFMDIAKISDSALDALDVAYLKKEFAKVKRKIPIFKKGENW